LECCKALPAGLLHVTEATVSRIAGDKRAGKRASRESRSYPP